VTREPITDLLAEAIVAEALSAVRQLAGLDEATRMDAINRIRLALHEHSPHRAEPVDCVLWVDAAAVAGNDYNPNHVARPEMDLLRLSIEADGFTQPIVAWPDADGRYTVVDGFHRHLVGKEYPAVAGRLHGRLPVTVIRSERTGEADRRASTVRHNRARGTHGVEEMGELVQYLARMGWDDVKIGTELGMEQDEVLRLRQIANLEIFAEREFSQAWEAEISAAQKRRPFDPE
jgi:ParB-like chromosome segregation protein Spo0J